MVNIAYKVLHGGLARAGLLPSKERREGERSR